MHARPHILLICSWPPSPSYFLQYFLLRFLILFPCRIVGIGISSSGKAKLKEGNKCLDTFGHSALRSAMTLTAD